MNVLYDILSVIGALGLFLYGMKVMSEGVQRAGGASMRKILNAMTRSQGRAIFTGFATTSVLQSSSATTVMVVSFVNAGLLQLREAFGVIMGANIGTTVTAWLIALALGKFSVAELALPLIAITLPFFFMKNERLKNTAEVFIGFALLFIGLSALQSVVPTLRENEAFEAFISSYSNQGYLSILLFIIVGSLVTIIIQSSSAAIALTLALLSSGIIPLELAAGMVLGENIGTTVTANFAAVVANSHAKKAARAHLIFNLVGVLWMLPLLPYFLDGLTFVYKQIFADVNVFGTDSNRVLLALFHTTFNLLNMLLLIGFTDGILKIAGRLVRAKVGGDAFKLEYIGAGVVGTPELALLEAHKEMRKYARITASMNQMISRLLDVSDPVEKKLLLDEIRETEEITDKYEMEVANYLTDLSKEEMSPTTSVRVRGLMGATNDLERIGDLYLKIAENLEGKNLKKVYFVPKQRQNLKDMLDLLKEAFDIMYTNLTNEDSEPDVIQAQEKEKEVNELRNDLKRKHFRDVAKGRYSFESGIFYSDTFTAMEEIADHVVAISEGLSAEF
ncbi:MAG: phosphate:Na+ symporter [Flavobacteriales bacterium]|jgi:phosphate:Na+ symporter